MVSAEVAVEEQERARTGERWPFVAALGLVALCLRYARLYHFNVVDDAMTSMQYAKQLALGNGLVFNLGERVEGYSNFAWVLFMTPIYWLATHVGFDFVRAVTLCNIALATANLLLVYLLARRWLADAPLAIWLAVGLCVVDNSFAVWAVLGLEVHLLALFMLLALWVSESTLRHRRWFLGATLLGAHLTRPDAGLFCAVLLGNQAVDAWLERRRGLRAEANVRAVQTLSAAGVWLLGYGAYFYLRYRYYGQLLPNTYYLKLGGPLDAWARGVAYLRGFLDERAFAPLLALCGGLALRVPAIRALLVYNLLHAAYVVYVGGDFFAGHRFFVPEIPQLALLSAVGVAELARRANTARAAELLARARLSTQHLVGAAAMASACLLGVVFQRGVVRGALQGEVLTWGSDLTRQTRLFRWLAEHKPADASIATCLIGHTGFYSSARVIDMCGVIDPEVARRHVPNFGKGKAGHEKLASAAETLAKQPTFIVSYIIPGDLWRHGYFLRADLPDDTFEGIWQRDTLLQTGTLLSETRISFDGGRPLGWVGNGSAFEDWPSRSKWSGQGELVGATGGFINTFHPSLGNAATGQLDSAPFELMGDQLLFRLAGGHDAQTLRAELLVDGKPLFTTTGRNGDQLSRRSWDISALRGKHGVLRVVDNSTGPWGYLALDEIVQWRQ
jgi:hypothetical protein